MEHLTKQQLILVGLLVSFVTSIVTGIVTLSLVDQNYQGPSYTINRVVERTIEKVIPSEGQAPVQKETVVVDLSDQAASAAEKGEKGLVRISSEEATTGFVGVILTKDGIVATDISATTLKEPKASLGNSKGIALRLATTSAEYGIALYAMELPEGTVPTVLGSASLSSLRLAQSVVAVGGTDSASVSLGNVRGKLEKGEEGAKIQYGIKTDIDAPDLGFGNVLVTLSGDFAGIYVGTLAKVSGGSYVSSDIVKALLK